MLASRVLDPSHSSRVGVKTCPLLCLMIYVCLGLYLLSTCFLPSFLRRNHGNLDSMKPMCLVYARCGHVLMDVPLNIVFEGF
jgi:hypothetical protein